MKDYRVKNRWRQRRHIVLIERHDACDRCVWERRTNISRTSLAQDFPGTIDTNVPPTNINIVDDSICRKAARALAASIPRGQDAGGQIARDDAFPTRLRVGIRTFLAGLNVKIQSKVEPSSIAEAESLVGSRNRNARGLSGPGGYARTSFPGTAVVLNALVTPTEFFAGLRTRERRHGEEESKRELHRMVCLYFYLTWLGLVWFGSLE
jgi:hypothetical protein